MHNNSHFTALVVHQGVAEWCDGAFSIPLAAVELYMLATSNKFVVHEIIGAQPCVLYSVLDVMGGGKTDDHVHFDADDHNFFSVVVHGPRLLDVPGGMGGDDVRGGSAVGAPVTLAEALEIEADTDVDIARVTKMVSVMACRPLRHQPELVTMKQRNVKITDLPMQPDSGNGPKTTVHIVDVHRRVRIDWDFDDIGSSCLLSNHNELPEQLRPARASVVPYLYSFVILPPGNSEVLQGEVDIIKHFWFENAVPVTDACQLCSGTPHLINVGADKKAGA